jgi:predicted Zn-dependent protease
LALTPNQELALGRQAFQELKSKKRVLTSGPEVEQVRRVGARITQAAENELLQREINLRVHGYRFEWEFEVFDEKQINAFCLPAGKVGVFSGLLRELKPTDDQLAAVMAHEIAHALAHHGSERLARQQLQRGALDNVLDHKMNEDVIGVLAAGAQLRSLAYDRAQESEADHIGVFLMEFADYDSNEAIEFWENMVTRNTAGRVQLPEILSDHPSGPRRIAQLRVWAPYAKAAKRAFDEGRTVASPRKGGS